MKTISREENIVCPYGAHRVEVIEWEAGDNVCIDCTHCPPDQYGCEGTHADFTPVVGVKYLLDSGCPGCLETIFKV